MSLLKSLRIPLALASLILLLAAVSARATEGGGSGLKTLLVDPAAAGGTGGATTAYSSSASGASVAGEAAGTRATDAACRFALRLGEVGAEREARFAAEVETVSSAFDELLAALPEQDHYDTLVARAKAVEQARFPGLLSAPGIRARIARKIVDLGGGARINGQSFLGNFKAYALIPENRDSVIAFVLEMLEGVSEELPKAGDVADFARKAERLGRMGIPPAQLERILLAWSEMRRTGDSSDFALALLARLTEAPRNGEQRAIGALIERAQRDTRPLGQRLQLGLPRLGAGFGRGIRNAVLAGTLVLALGQATISTRNLAQAWHERAVAAQAIERAEADKLAVVEAQQKKAEEAQARIAEAKQAAAEKAAAAAQAKANAARRAQMEQVLAHPAIHPTIRAIFRQHKEPIALVDALHNFLLTNPSLSDQDVYALLELMPQGTDWGYQMKGQEQTYLEQEMKRRDLGDYAPGDDSSAFHTVDKEVIYRALEQVRRVTEPARLLGLAPRIHAWLQTTQGWGGWTDEYKSSNYSLLDEALKDAIKRAKP